MKLVVGLGNPGRSYEQTRHNVGFEVVDELAGRGGTSFRRGWLVSAETAKAVVDGAELLLVKPRTFMNLSGQAVVPLMKRKGLGPADLIVVVDDVELDIGRLRVRAKGGAGGHKGLQSVIQHLGSEEFVRVRVGVGPRPAGDELVEHVLSRFSAEERRRVDEAVGRAADAAVTIARSGVERAMNEFNGEKSGGGEP